MYFRAFALTWQNASKQLHSEMCQLKIPPIFVRSNISSHPWSQHGKNKVLRETAVSWESIDLSQFYLHPLLGWWAVSLISNDNTRLGPLLLLLQYMTRQTVFERRQNMEREKWYFLKYFSAAELFVFYFVAAVKTIFVIIRGGHAVFHSLRHR